MRRRVLLVAVLSVGVAALCAAVMPGVGRSAGGVSGAYGDPNGDYLSFTLTGADVTLEPGTTNSYKGTAAAGATIRLTGLMQVNRNDCGLSYVTMSAAVETNRWSWPTGGGSSKVNCTTVKQTFDVSYTTKVAASDAAVSAGAGLNICGGVCGGYSVSFSILVKAAATKPRTSTPKPKTPTGRPTVQAFAPSGFQEPGETVALEVAVKDASGKATLHATLFQGGTAVRRAVGTGTADGSKWTWKAKLDASLTGPLYYCAWAENASGEKSAGAPESSCKWLRMIVPIARVSNGCGGEGWKSIVAIENYLGNVHSYVDSNVNPLAESYTVSFKPACDLHDAGYSGVTVRDGINGGIVDYHDWTRFQVDHKFWHDMMELCDTAIPASATVARQKCHGYGSRYTPTSIGSETLFSLVRQYGDQFFDADLKTPGYQEKGARDNS